MGHSINVVLETTVSFCQQLRCGGQVTLGRVQIDMSKIDGEGRQKDLHVRTCPIPFRQPVNRERVAKMPNTAFSAECRVPENAESRFGICWKRLDGST
jgi:hypothetical protein